MRSMQSIVVDPRMQEISGKTRLERAAILKSWHFRCSFSETTQKRRIRPRQPRPSIDSVKLPVLKKIVDYKIVVAMKKEQNAYF